MDGYEPLPETSATLACISLSAECKSDPAEDNHVVSGRARIWKVKRGTPSIQPWGSLQCWCELHNDAALWALPKNLPGTLTQVGQDGLR